MSKIKFKLGGDIVFTQIGNIIFIIIALIYGYREEDNECLKEDSIGLDLAEWLIWYGWAGVVTYGVIILSSLLVLLNKKMLGIPMGIFGIYCLFSIIWLVLGFVIFFRSNLDCFHTSQDIGIVGFVILMLSVNSSSTIFNIISINTNDEE